MATDGNAHTHARHEGRVGDCLYFFQPGLDSAIIHQSTRAHNLHQSVLPGLEHSSSSRAHNLRWILRGHFFRGKTGETRKGTKELIFVVLNTLFLLFLTLWTLWILWILWDTFEIKQKSNSMDFYFRPFSTFSKYRAHDHPRPWPSSLCSSPLPRDGNERPGMRRAVMITHWYSLHGHFENVENKVSKKRKEVMMVRDSWLMMVRDSWLPKGRRPREYEALSFSRQTF